MKIRTLVKLAKAGDKNLVEVSTRWTKNSGAGLKNPVITAIRYCKWNKFENIFLLLTVGLLVFKFNKPESDGYFDMALLLFLFVGALCHLKMPRRKERCDLNQFIEALTMLENEDGEVVVKIPSKEGGISKIQMLEPDTLSCRADHILRKQSLKVSHLQQIPWNSDLAVKEKAYFNKLHRYFLALELVERDHGVYYP